MSSNPGLGRTSLNVLIQSGDAGRYVDLHHFERHSWLRQQ